jgi:hypothetical protein
MFLFYRHLLSADTRDDRLLWCMQLNKALAMLRAWGRKSSNPWFPGCIRIHSFTTYCKTPANLSSAIAVSVSVSYIQVMLIKIIMCNERTVLWKWRLRSSKQSSLWYSTTELCGTWSLSTDTTFFKECSALTLNMEEKFEVLQAVFLKVQIVLDVMLCHWVSSSLHFKRSCCLIFKSQVVQEEWSVKERAAWLTMKKKAVKSFETWGSTHPTKQHHILSLNLQNCKMWQHKTGTCFTKIFFILTLAKKE